MFPSGRWRGFWEQPGFGRQPMHELVLRFAEGQIEGQGHDVVGPFVFGGSYDRAGRIHLIKQYIGRHQVLYLGEPDGEGAIVGRWTLTEQLNGPFALSPLDVPRAAEEEITAIHAPSR